MSEQNAETKRQDIERQVLRWADFPSQRLSEFIDDAKKQGKNPDEIALGYGIALIVGDDENAFSPLIFGGFSLEASQLARKVIERRLDWEIGLPQMPEAIKKQLEAVRKKLQEIDWSTNGGFNSGYEIWKRDARAWVRQYRKSNPEVEKAFVTFSEFADFIGKR